MESKHQNWILSGTEAPAGKDRVVAAIGADGGSCQLVEEGLPADLASVGLRGAWEEPEEPVGTLVDTPFLFPDLCFLPLCSSRLRGLLALFMTPHYCKLPCAKHGGKHAAFHSITKATFWHMCNHYPHK